MKNKIGEIKLQWEGRKHRLSYYDAAAVNIPSALAVSEDSASSCGLSLFCAALDGLYAENVPQPTQTEGV
jgi:hypothetical protein